MKDYPVGKAQAMVLAALGLTATGYADAERIFKAHGFSVAARRVGKTTQPEIRMLDTVAGGFTADGDGWSENIDYAKIDLAPVAQWIVE